jgi:hypothetical protein
MRSCESSGRECVPFVSITTKSLSSAKHSTDTAASDTPLGDRVLRMEGEEGKGMRDRGCGVRGGGG